MIGSKSGNTLSLHKPVWALHQTACAFIVFCFLWGGMINQTFAQDNSLLSNDQGQGPFSYANIQDVHVSHIALDLTTDFKRSTLKGIALLRLQWLNQTARTLVLDSDSLDISKIEAFGKNGWEIAPYSLSNGDNILGQKLSISADNTVRAIRIFYKTDATAKGLDWYEAKNTSNKQQPFLTSLWGPTHVRSWIPLQDTPAIKTTFEARIHTNQSLTALMSAQQDPDTRLDGDYYFYMREDISPHQITLIVGQLGYKKLNNYFGVYGPPNKLEELSASLINLPKTGDAAIKLLGLKPFKRLDFILAPMSFSKNHQTTPRLSLISPNIIHKNGEINPVFFDILGESFMGNIVGNKTWADAWLTKGLGNFIGDLIQKETGETKLVRHRRARKFFNLDFLLRDDTLPLPNLYEHGIYPNAQAGFDEGTTLKAFFFFTMIEDIVKKETISMFLKTWMKDNKDQVKTTAEFQHFIAKNLLYLFPDHLPPTMIDDWLYQDGLPANFKEPQSDELLAVESDALEWLSDNISINELPAGDWTTFQWLHFLETIADDVKNSQMDGLNKQWHLSTSPKANIQAHWFQLVLKSRYEPGYKELEQFLENQKQEALILPLYDQMSDNMSRLAMAQKIYEIAKDGYHKSTQIKLNKILKLPNK